MALTLANVRRTSKSRYGLPYSTAEDPVFTDAMMLEIINQAYSWFAGATLCCYTRDMTPLNLTMGTSEYALGGTVIKPDHRTFWMRYYTAGPVQVRARLAARSYPDLVEQYGTPIESVTAGVPLYFFIHGGTASGSSKNITLVPSPSGLLNSAGADTVDATRSIHYSAWVYPAELTSDSDNLMLDEPDVYRLVPAICWHMAMFEASRGRNDAPVNMWAETALREAAEFHRIILEGTRTFDRSAPVFITPAMEGMAARQSRAGGGGG